MCQQQNFKKCYYVKKNDVKVKTKNEIKPGIFANCPFFIKTEGEINL